MKKGTKACGKKWLWVWMIVVLVISLQVISISVQAAANGIYIAKATSHYKHPITGNIEDSGGSSSAVLGQSMTESATYHKALVEVDTAGNTYITVRLQLMDNIQNPQFQVDGIPVTADITQENFGAMSEDNTADFRMQVNSENSIIRCSMYVVPMGRDVIFYITVSDLQIGNEDFVPYVEVVAPVAEAETSQTESEAMKAEIQITEVTDVSETIVAVQETESGLRTEVVTETTQETQVVEVSVNEEMAQAQTTEPTIIAEKNLPDENVPLGIQEFDAEGNLIMDNEDNNQMVMTQASSATVQDSLTIWIILSVALVAATGFGIWYVCFFRVKK